MNRDLAKNEGYFNSFILKRSEGVEKSIQRLKDGVIPEERIPITMRSIGASKLRIIVAKYSGCYSISEIEKDYRNLLKNYPNYWITGQVLMKHNGRDLKQYIDYDDMLWILSLGILFNVSNREFQVLSELIKRDGVKDIVYEFLISCKLGNRNCKVEESYEFGWDLYSSLRKVVKEEVPEESKIKLLSKSLNSDWEKDHKEILKSLKGRHETYFGAWSFEAAAITCIMGLDDSNYRNNRYYPKDLVDYYKSTHTT